MDKQRDRVEEIPNGFFLAEPDEWIIGMEPCYRMEYFIRRFAGERDTCMNGDEPDDSEWI